MAGSSILIMSYVETLLLLVLTTHSLTFQPMTFIEEMERNDVIVNTRKGYGLRRIGRYSPDIEESIIHTFLPLNDFCMVSSDEDVCVYGLAKTKKK